jgi:hypothetical protein
VNPDRIYPSDWPRCPGCGDFALDGHITCGSVLCNERDAREQRLAWNAPAPRKEDVSEDVDLDADGFDLSERDYDPDEDRTP